MARNIEMKMVLDSKQWHSVWQRAEMIAGPQRDRLIQTDTFFHSPNDRIKLRQIEGADAELIVYARTDEPHLRQSSL